MKKFLKLKKNRAVFLDRDGVINKKAKEHDYIKNWGEFEFLPDVGKTIRKLNKDFLIVVITNQRGIGRGVMSFEGLEEIHRKMKAGLNRQKAKIDKIYFCPHKLDENCECRKPNPGLILKASRDLNINLKNSFMVGDSIEDIEAGKKAGCKTIFLKNKASLKKHGNKTIKTDFIIKNFSELTKVVKNGKIDF